MRTRSVEVEIDVCLSEFTDDEIAKEAASRGIPVFEQALLSDLAFAIVRKPSEALDALKRLVAEEPCCAHVVEVGARRVR